MAEPGAIDLLAAAAAEEETQQNLLARDEDTTNNDDTVDPSAAGFGPSGNPSGGASGGNMSGQPQPAGGTTPPTSHPRGLVAALMAQESVGGLALAAALQWQQHSGGSQDKQKEFWDQMCVQTTLNVLGYTTNGSSKMQLIYGVGPVHDLDCDDMRGSLIGFSGDRDVYGGQPAAVKLPTQNSWKRKTVKQDFDEGKFETFYADNANTDKLRPEGDRDAATSEDLPRLLLLPGKLGIYAAEKPRTWFEIYSYAKALEAQPENNITEDDIKLVKKYCIAASYEDTGNESILVLKPVLSATSMAPGFARFKQAKLDHLLGPMQPMAQQGQVGTAQPNTQLNQMQSFVATLGNTVQQMGTTMQQVVKQGANQVTALQQGQALQKSGKFYDPVQVAYFKGQAHTTSVNNLPPILALIQGMTNKTSVRAHVVQQMQKWSTDKNIPIQPDLYLSNEVIDDLSKGDWNGHEMSLTFKRLERGLNPMVCIPRAHDETETLKDRDRAEDETAANRTMSERLGLLATDPRHPPQNFEEFKLFAATFAALCFVFTGDSPLYRDVLAIRLVLNEAQVYAKRNYFTLVVCAQFTWAMCSYTRQYTATRVHPDDFAQGKIPAFPRSDMAFLLPQIQGVYNHPDPTFPQKWNLPPAPPQKQRLPQAPPTFIIPTPTARDHLSPDGGTEDTRCASTHPQLVDLMAALKLAGHSLSLTAICQAANTSVPNLPYLNKFARYTNGKLVNKMCWMGLLGLCNKGDKCRFNHALRADLAAGFVDAVCKALKPGVDYLVKNKTPNAPTNSDAKRRRK
eukprot:scaffold7389_cov73-Skeletonema_dohrnii-CCMP3373.AAC.2